ncbi:hypothetical protein KKE34_02795 [Patescibacteria group bacterium]|nr:hypothetical protein [Patescibacteria group bacterium]MBU1885517.1 hypothetical protein [Patescibacteria group bacterium]
MIDSEDKEVETKLKSPEVSREQLVSQALGQLKERIFNVLSTQSPLQELVIDGASAADLLSLQPSILGMKTEDGETVSWGGEGSAVAEVFTPDVVKPILDAEIRKQLDNVPADAPAWKEFAIISQDEVTVSLANGMKLKVFFKNIARLGEDHDLQPQYAVMQSPTTEYNAVVDRILEEFRNTSQVDKEEN